jgi:hypothetical protein
VGDAYALLGVSPGASEQEVRRAYRQAARRLHPDLQPEHLREQSGRRLQAVNAARAQVLEDIRRRPAAGASVPPYVPRQRGSSDPPRDAQDDGWGDARRHAEHQDWLHTQQRVIDDWNLGRQAREEQRRVQAQRLGRSRAPRTGWAALVMLLALQVVVVWAVVHGVEAVFSQTTATPGSSVSSGHTDLDLRGVLALLASWRS